MAARHLKRLSPGADRGEGFTKDIGKPRRNIYSSRKKYNLIVLLNCIKLTYRRIPHPESGISHEYADRKRKEEEACLQEGKGEIFPGLLTPRLGGARREAA